MDFTKVLKTAAWTEAEVGVMIAGALTSVRFLDDSKLFKAKFASNPEWFKNDRPGAPWYIKWSGAGKAVAAVGAIAWIPKMNPWVKLALIGVAFQGTLQQARILTYDKTNSKYRVDQIGKTQAQIDEELRELADKYRGTNGPDYIGSQKYVGAEYATRYSSAVAGKEDLGDRYRSAVAGIFDEDNYRSPFSFRDSDSTAVG